MLDRLVTVADLADRAGLAIMPTLFTGHMSGVNWIPPLGSGRIRPRPPLPRRGRRHSHGSRPAQLVRGHGDRRAQALLAGEAAAALAGHDALWAWDLGNENSNCVRPPSRSAARAWLQQMSAAIRAADETAFVTIGLHMEDLQEDRQLGPPEASETCDLLSMHGYPIYASWADSPTDEQLLPFLARITRWLGNGRDVLFTEFGLPTYRRRRPDDRRPGAASPLLVDEEAAAATPTGPRGPRGPPAAPARWSGATATTTRRSGRNRRSTSRPTSVPSGSGEPTARPSRPSPSWRRSRALAGYSPRPEEFAWIDLEPDEFLAEPNAALPRLYARYRASGRARAGDSR